MGIPSPEASQQDVPLIRFVVPVGIDKMHEVAALADIDSSVTESKTGWHVKVVGEDGRFIGTAIAIAVFENNQLVDCVVGRDDLRVGQCGQHPQSTRRIPVHTNRVGYTVGFVGEQISLVAISQGE